MLKKLWWLIVILLMAIAFAAGYYCFALQHKNSAATRKAPVSDTLALAAAAITPRDIEFTQKYVGRILPIHEAKVQPFISGFIEKIYVKGGEYVKQGDILLTLQQDQYLAALEAAYANVLQAQADLSNAETYFTRIQKAGKNSVSPTEADNAKAQFLSAQAKFEYAKANLAAAEVNYNYTVIRSPIDGLVGDVSLTVGNYVSPSSGELFSIMQYSPIRVMFSVTDKEFLTETSKPSPFYDDKIFLKLADDTIFTNSGEFKYTDNNINAASNAIAVFADFNNIGKTLIPNAYVTVLIKHIFKYSVQVSKNLILLENDGNYVFIIRDGKIIKEKVNILASEKNDFILENTFKKGDALLTEAMRQSYYNHTITPKFADNNLTKEDKK